MPTLSYAEHWSIVELAKVLIDDTADNLLTRVNVSKIDALQTLIDISQICIVRVYLSDFILRLTTHPTENVDSIINSLEAHIANQHVYDPSLNILFHRNSMIQFCKNIRLLKENTYEDGFVIGLISAGLAEMDLICSGFIYLSILGFKCLPRIDYGVDQVRRVGRIAHEFSTNTVNIVTAGMEAALFAIVAQLSTRPVLCVPSNVSYGYGRDGEASMLSLIFSDIAGQGIFNNTNIFGACIVAANIVEATKRRRQRESKHLPVANSNICFTIEEHAKMAQKLRMTLYVGVLQRSIKSPRRVFILYTVSLVSNLLDECINILEQVENVNVSKLLVDVVSVLLSIDSIEERLAESDCVIIAASNGCLPAIIGGINKQIEKQGQGVPLIAVATSLDSQAIKSIVNTCANNFALTNSMKSAVILALSIILLD